jgi:UDP-N-acetylmuramoylalanine--D-glutamate ligase
VKFDPKFFKGKTAVVIGLGRSGLACAKLLAHRGFRVLASDAKPATELKELFDRPSRSAQHGRITVFGGGHPAAALRGDFAVKSPGLKPTLPVFRTLKKLGIPIFSELDIALVFCKTEKIIAITGTNGKSTTTALAGEIFRQSLSRGQKAWVGGNIGTPVSDIAPKAGAYDALILETSSYQLEDSRSFHPKAAAILNITPDHIDHHGSLMNYRAAKGRIFKEQTFDDFCVFNADDPETLKLSRRCSARKLYFAVDRKPGVHAYCKSGRIIVRMPAQKAFELVPPNLPGTHNLENAMAAVLLASALELKPAAIQRGLKSFKGLEHRLESVASIDGIRCINDSKATNVDSTLIALRALSPAPGGILLILGGLDKGNPYGPLEPLIKEKVKGIFTIGAAAPLIERDLKGASSIFRCEDIKTAVRTALKAGSPGDVLLLSPACASFDQFENFEDRGRQFKAIIRNLSA